MKTFKLLLKSLINNNACITGARKKPWFFAAIMFFLSMILAIVPLFVSTMKAKADDVFASYNYGADVAVLRFNEYLDENNIQMVVKTSPDGKKFISCEKDGAATSVTYPHYTTGRGENNEEIQVLDYCFIYRTSYSSEILNEILGDSGASYFYISEDQVVMHIAKPSKTIGCLQATKYLNEGRSINGLLSAEEDVTTKLNQTFSNWRKFLNDSYNYSRLTAVWQNCLLIGGINIAITLFMGFMIWILTRGKNNPYRMFNLWETQKMSWWCTITPALLALGLGFLLKTFAQVLFPMLIGVRVMWLSMKSLRPDGSGYAESND